MTGVHDFVITRRGRDHLGRTGSALGTIETPRRSEENKRANDEKKGEKRRTRRRSGDGRGDGEAGGWAFTQERKKKMRKMAAAGPATRKAP